MERQHRRRGVLHRRDHDLLIVGMMAVVVTFWNGRVCNADLEGSPFGMVTTVGTCWLLGTSDSSVRYENHYWACNVFDLNHSSNIIFAFERERLCSNHGVR